jgi:CRISPR-associated protein Cas1
MPVLHTHRSTFLLLERAKVYVEDGRLLYEQAQDGNFLSWNIPSATVSVLAIGQGSSITSDAARVLAADQVGVLLTGTDGIPVFLASLSDYRPTDRFQAWMRAWPNPAWRLTAAKIFQQRRIRHLQQQWIAPRPNIDDVLSSFATGIETAESVPSLMGHEAQLAKALYRKMSEHTSIAWTGRRDGADPTPIEQRLNQGNYLAYGLASMVLWTVGLVPSLPVSHGSGRAGGLVFDLADVIKDAFVLPKAFEQLGRPSAAYRQDVARGFQKAGLFAELVSVLDEALCVPS